MRASRVAYGRPMLSSMLVVQVLQRLILSGGREEFHLPVESVWGAVPGFRPVRFPRPLSEPGVRITPHRALHVTMPSVGCLSGGCPGGGDGVSPVEIPGYRHRSRVEQLCPGDDQPLFRDDISSLKLSPWHAFTPFLAFP